MALVSLLLLGFDDEFGADYPAKWSDKSPCMNLEKQGEAQRRPNDQGASAGEPNDRDVSADKRKSAAEFDEVVTKHQLWLTTNKKAGSRADFIGNKELDGANFTKMNMSQASFIGASLRLADLSNSTFDGADLSYADLSGADLSYSSFKKVQLYGADLSCSHLVNTDLTGAAITCMFDNGMRCPDLTGADLRGTKLADARLGTTSLEGATFEPESLPNVRDIASASGLEHLTYQDSPDALFQLRKLFQDGGFQFQERQITYAINRRQTEGSDPITRWFNTVAFDWTTQYGMNPGRALKIWLCVFLGCWFLYALILRFSSSSGVYFVTNTAGTDQAACRERIQAISVGKGRGLLHGMRILGREVRLVCWAGYFSLLSAFNIGFHEIDFGRWLRLLTKSEFDLKAEGWARTVAGFQSLVSMYLMALWVLTYFGRPFT